MKHLVISAILLILIAAVVIGDSVIVINKCNDLIKSVDELNTDKEHYFQNENLDGISKVCEKWNKASKIFDVSVNRNLFDEVDEKLLNIKEYAKAENYPDYMRSLAVLEDALNKIRMNSSVSFESIM